MSVLGFGENFECVAAAGAGAAVTLSRHAPGVTPSHEHAHAYLCILLSGALSQQGGGKESFRRPGDVVVHPAGDRHANRIADAGALCLNLHLPDHLASDALERSGSPAVRTLAEALASAVVLPTGDTLDIDGLAAELRSRIFDDRPERCGMAIERVMEALEDDPARPWSMQDLGDLTGRHPTHLARAFRDHTGLSIGGWRRRRRLTRLEMDLRCGRESLTDLALRHGYADQPHMSREFKVAFGRSPGDWRRRAL